MKKLLFLFLLQIYFTASGQQKSFAVVELFTSEGCNTCPPADKLFSSMKAEAKKSGKNIFFLEYHVDYWNKLGWKDPYSSFQFTNRQKNYTSVLNEESMYTPMMIVNGAKSFTGSDKQKADAAIEEALLSPPTAGLKIKVDSIISDTLYLRYDATNTDKNFLIRTAITEDGIVSKISAGENSNMTLSHDGVVRVFNSSELSKLSSQIKIPLKKFQPGKKCELIVFIQHKQSMKVLAVASANF
jgi:hypothetical protein